MNPFVHLVIATVFFLGTHFVSSTPLRGRLAKVIGEGGYLGVYSLVSLAGIVWMSWAYSHAPFQRLWDVPGFKFWPLVIMPIALILIVAGVMTRNPTAVRQQGALHSAEPAYGIIRVTRHPVMWGIMLWAGVHVLARGDLASLIFFGGFFALAAIGTGLIDTRKAAALGQDWKRFAAATSNVPFGAIVSGRNRFNFAEIGWVKLSAGLAVYAVLLFAHPFIFGARAY
jgi:uncharacterized membrane protein